jgi:hypothetical protein
MSLLHKKSLMRKKHITYSMNKTISATGSVHRKTFTRFFGQAFLLCSFGLALRIDRLQAAIWKTASLFGLRSEFRQLNIKRRKYATDYPGKQNTFVA